MSADENPLASARGDPSGGCFVCDSVALQRREHGDARDGLSRRKLLAGFIGTGIAGATLGGRALAQPASTSRANHSSKSRTVILEPSWTLMYVNGDVELVRDRSVVVQGDRIADIVDGRVRGREHRIPLFGQLLLPGLISGHTHVACGSPTRGIIESGRPFRRAVGIIELLDDEDLDALTAYNLAEILRAGCTTQLEQSVSLKQAQSYVRVARRWGVRGYPGGMVPGWSRLMPIWQRSGDRALLDSVPETLAEIQANLEFCLSVNGAEEGRILPMMTPHGPETHTPETLRAFAAAAQRLGNGMHTHLATIPADSATVKRLWGKGPVQWLEEFGFYDMRLFGAHMIGWDAASDAKFLAGKPLFTYVHCPSGAGAGSGQSGQPFIEALGAGINTCVGLDTHSNDLVENMKLAVLYGRARLATLGSRLEVPAKRPTVWDMIKTVTLYPANGLGRHDLGRIAVGAKADLTSIDVTGFLVGAGTIPLEPLNNLLYAGGLSVRHVMTDGRTQIADGRLVVDDERRVIMGGARVVERIWKQLAEEGFFTHTAR